MPRSLLRPLVLAAILLLPSPAAAQEVFSLRVAGAAEGWRPLVGMDGLLGDAALRRALESGLPLRMRLRVELWEKRLFDRLAGEQEVALAIVQDPIDRVYLVDLGRAERRVRSLVEAERAVEAAFRLALRPSHQGRYYYLGTLEVETLSLSDLDELRRWLRGEAGPAFKGEAPPERALARGMSRVLVRVLGLPTRRYEARSGTFAPR